MPMRLLAALFAVAAAAQQQPSPIEAAVQAFHQNPSSPDLVAHREQARALLAKAPADAPQFPSWVRSVAQMYDMAGRTADARAVIIEALSRTPKPHPARAELLNILANSWRSDGNLLRAVDLLEEAAALPANVVQTNRFLHVNGAALPWQDQQLADLYQTLGRPEAAAAVLAKVEERLRTDPAALAGFYEQQGRIDDAIASYKRAAAAHRDDEPPNPWTLQSLARLYARQQKYDEAIAALEDAIVANPALTRPFRQQLAGILQQAGRTEDADAVYRQIIADEAATHDTSGSALTVYAFHLSQTGRGEQAETSLKEFLAANPTLPPNQQSSVLMTLAAVARQGKNADRSAEYQRAAIERNPAMSRDAAKPVATQQAELAGQALAAGKLDDAFTALLRAIDSAAADPAQRSRIVYSIPNQIAQLAAKKQTAQAEELYRRIFSQVEGWSDTRDRFLPELQQSYIRFLMQQPARYPEIPNAIARYREMLAASHGADTSAPEQALRIALDFERFHGSKTKAVEIAEELANLEGSLSGNTSEPYLRIVETLAPVYETIGDRDRAIAMRRRAVVIADRVLRPDNPGRAQTRIQAALALLRYKEFEEADQYAAQALGLADTPTLTRQVKDIRTQIAKAQSNVLR